VSAWCRMNQALDIPKSSPGYSMHAADISFTCDAVKAEAKATPLTTFGRPRGCMPAGAEGQKLLFASTSQVKPALFKGIDTGSLRLAGAPFGITMNGCGLGI